MSTSNPAGFCRLNLIMIAGWLIMIAGCADPTAEASLEADGGHLSGATFGWYFGENVACGNDQDCASNQTCVRAPDARTAQCVPTACSGPSREELAFYHSSADNSPEDGSLSNVELRQADLWDRVHGDRTPCNHHGQVHLSICRIFDHEVTAALDYACACLYGSPMEAHHFPREYPWMQSGESRRELVCPPSADVRDAGSPVLEPDTDFMQPDDPDMDPVAEPDVGVDQDSRPDAGSGADIDAGATFDDSGPDSDFPQPDEGLEDPVDPDMFAGDPDAGSPVLEPDTDFMQPDDPDMDPVAEPDVGVDQDSRPDAEPELPPVGGPGDRCGPNLDCPENFVLDGDCLCFCPETLGYEWDPNDPTTCNQLCDPQVETFNVDTGDCECRNGLELVNDRCVLPCPNGFVRNEQEQCRCPNGEIEIDDPNAGPGAEVPGICVPECRPDQVRHEETLQCECPGDEVEQFGVCVPLCIDLEPETIDCPPGLVGRRAPDGHQQCYGAEVMIEFRGHHGGEIVACDEQPGYDEFCDRTAEVPGERSGYCPAHNRCIVNRAHEVNPDTSPFCHLMGQRAFNVSIGALENTGMLFNKGLQVVCWTTEGPVEFELNPQGAQVVNRDPNLWVSTAGIMYDPPSQELRQFVLSILRDEFGLNSQQMRADIGINMDWLEAIRGFTPAQQDQLTQRIVNEIERRAAVPLPFVEGVNTANRLDDLMQWVITTSVCDEHIEAGDNVKPLAWHDYAGSALCSGETPESCRSDDQAQIYCEGPTCGAKGESAWQMLPNDTNNDGQDVAANAPVAPTEPTHCSMSVLGLFPGRLIDVVGYHEADMGWWTACQGRETPMGHNLDPDDPRIVRGACLRTMNDRQAAPYRSHQGNEVIGGGAVQRTAHRVAFVAGGNGEVLRHENACTAMAGHLFRLEALRRY